VTEADRQQSGATFDLIYVSHPDGQTMSCAVKDSSGDHMIGPFPGKEAGPRIVEGLMGFPELGFAEPKEAENAYIMTHFRNMSLKENSAGQPYPFKVHS
jgi:hypothetical protein